ncbi:MAG: DsrE family protein [Chloroflexi bacterium]|nr:DsrE family protein [Chloroflexota bacterium]
MSELGLVLTTSPLQYQNGETVVHVAEAALDRGHGVRIFLYLDGVYNPLRYQTFPDMAVMPWQRFQALAERGADIVACGLCVNARGLQGGKDFVSGIRIGGLPDFAAMVGEVDRLVCL